MLGFRILIVSKIPDSCFYLFIHLFIYQLFRTQACPEGMCTNWTQIPCGVPSSPIPQSVKVNHTTAVYAPYSFRIVMWFLLRPTRTNQWKCCGTRPTHGFSFLSERTRKCNRLQMSLQRQHFLLSYLNTLSVGPAGVWTRDLLLGRPALIPTELTTWRFLRLYSGFQSLRCRIPKAN